MVKYPNICLLLTGGHTEIYNVKSERNIILLGETLDDALGETFDKVAKLLGLAYPGGPEIENKALNGIETLYELPMPLINEDNLNFSFSGLKTAINHLVKKNNLSAKFVADLSASFQFCVSKILIKKIKKTIKKLSNDSVIVETLSVVGGVSNNKYICDKIKNAFEGQNIKIIFPAKEMMSDNAAMIAWNCLNKNIDSSSNIFFKANPRLTIK